MVSLYTKKRKRLHMNKNQIGTHWKLGSSFFERMPENSIIDVGGMRITKIGKTNLNLGIKKTVSWWKKNLKIWWFFKPCVAFVYEQHHIFISSIRCKISLCQYLWLKKRKMNRGWAVLERAHKVEINNSSIWRFIFYAAILLLFFSR